MIIQRFNIPETVNMFKNFNLIFILVISLGACKSKTREITLTVNACSSTYIRSDDDFHDENIETGGHGPNNFMNEYNAKSEICWCLCDQYIQTKDTTIGRYILKHFQNTEMGGFIASHYYADSIHQNAFRTFIIKPNLDSLCKYRNVFKKNIYEWND